MEPPVGYKQVHRRGVVATNILTLLLLTLHVLLSRCSTMSRATADTYDARIYTVCAPYLGQRGDKFIRKFAPEFKNGLGAITDEYGNLEDHLMGRDLAGINGPAYFGRAAAQAKQYASWKNRGQKLKTLIWKHVENTTIRQAIDAMVPLYNAAVNPAPPAPVGALPWGAPAGSSLGQVAWIVVDSYGRHPMRCTRSAKSQNTVSRISRWPAHGATSFQETKFQSPHSVERALGVTIEGRIQFPVSTQRTVAPFWGERRRREV
eukprot:6938539-Prymnesium_polylepis.1